MTKENYRYVYLTSNDTMLLAKMVEKHLNKGWELSGELMIVERKGGPTSFIQPMIKKPVRVFNHYDLGSLSFERFEKEKTYD